MAGRLFRRGALPLALVLTAALVLTPLAASLQFVPIPSAPARAPGAVPIDSSYRTSPLTPPAASPSSAAPASGCLEEGVMDSYCGHYFVGAEIGLPLPLVFCDVACLSPPILASLSATVTTPATPPSAGDNWAAILSAFDNAGLPSYDQVGFAPVAGIGWVPVYSYSTACGEPSGVDSFDATYTTLAENTSYTLSLTALGNGEILYAISDPATGAVVWTHTHDSGGTGFYATSYITCWNDLGMYSSYSVGEEVYAAHAGEFPSANITFQNVTTPSPLFWIFPFTWLPMVETAPGTYAGTEISGSTIVVPNVASNAAGDPAGSAHGSLEPASHFPVEPTHPLARSTQAIPSCRCW